MYGECENIGVLSGHTGAVMDLQFSTDGDTIYTASTDKTICFWDIKTGARIKKLKGNCITETRFQFIIDFNIS